MEKKEIRRLESLLVRGFEITNKMGEKVEAVPIGMPQIIVSTIQSTDERISLYAPSSANAYTSNWVHPDLNENKYICAVQYYFLKPSIKIQEICFYT